MRLRLLLICLSCALPLSACYASNPIEEPEGGARLRPIFLEAESGERIFDGWYDSELETECRFRVGADGRWRCTPPTLRLHGVYLDPACTEPVYLVEEGCAPPVDYAFTLDLGGADCPGAERATLHQVGEPVEATTLYHREDGACRPSEPTPAALYRLEPVDLAVFVTAELLEGSGGRLALDRVMAEDGATQPIGLRDTLRGERCSPYGVDSSGMGAERVPCVPGEVSQPVIIGGASCDETWAVGVDECWAPPDFAVHETTGACGRTTAIEVLRAVAPVPESELVSAEACAGITVTEAVTLEPADDAVAWMTREVRGAGRVKRMVWTDGALEIAALPYDSELETTCAAAPTADGELRCLPRMTHALPDDDRFVDDACTTPGYARGPTLCRSTWVMAWVRACSSHVVEAVYRIAEPAARGYRIDEDGACVPVEDEIVHRLEPVPLTDFARIERVTE